jgi:hypothetical protein
MPWPPPMHIDRDGTKYTHEFDEYYVRDKLNQAVPNILGPRVTPRATQ